MSSTVAPPATARTRFGRVAATLFGDERLRLCGLLLLVGLGLGPLPFVQRLDHQIHDVLLRLQPARAVDHAAVIAIDEKSLATLGRWPWSRDVHARLIRHLAEAGLGPLVLDIILTEDSGSADDALAAAMREHGDVWLPLHLQTVDDAVLELLPAAGFLAASRGVGHAHLPLDADGIVRGVRLYEGDPASPWPALALAVAASRPPAGRIGAHSRAVATPTDRVGIPFAGGTGHVPTLSYIDVLQGRIPASALQGRALFVGATAAGLGDFLATPFSGQGSPMPGVEIHATVYDGILTDCLIHTLPRPWSGLMLLLVILAAALLFPRAPPHLNWPLTVVLLAATIAISATLLFWQRIWLQPGAALLTITLAYPLWSWRRLRSMGRFLDGELQRLASEPGIDTLTPNDTPHHWAHLVVVLVQPERWQIVPRPGTPAGSRNPAADHDSAPAPAPAPAPESAERTLLCPLPGPEGATLRLTFGEQRQDVEAIGRFLESLNRSRERVLPSHRRRHERLERRIRQVRSAISSLRDMRHFVGDTLERMPDGILIGDDIGRLLYGNRSARAWLGSNPEVGTPITPLLAAHLEAPEQAACQQAIRDALVSGTGSSRTWARGDQAWVVVTAPLRLDRDDRQGVIITLSDISPIHRAQRERLETLHFISHDLRSPLSSQLAVLERARREQAGNPASAALLDELQQLCRKSLSLADDFLHLARVEADGDIPCYACDVADLVDNAVDTVAAQAKARGILIDVLDESTEGAGVMANTGLLERALGNLLNNAIKFSAPASTVTLLTTREGRYIRFSVKDQGPGIQPADLPRLFERFHRTASAEQSRKPGSGLGLRFVKTAALRLGGAAGVDSRPGEGSTFWIDVPEVPMAGH